MGASHHAPARGAGVHAWAGGSLTRGRRSVQENAAGTRRRGSLPVQHDDRLAHRDVASGCGQATCVGPLAGLFFSDDAAEIEHAKRLCATCPQRGCCLAGALQRREPWGVWGGELFQAGTVVARKRRRGRPRKHHSPDTAATSTPQ